MRLRSLPSALVSISKQPNADLADSHGIVILYNTAHPYMGLLMKVTSTLVDF